MGMNKKSAAPTVLLKLMSIICMSIFPFLLSLDGDFVFDDSEAIIKNKDVVSDSWEDLFYNDFWGSNIKSNLSHKSYRPLTILTYRINYLLSGSQLSAYHFKITNLVCHAICCVLVWWMCEAIIGPFDVNKRQDLDTGYLSTLLFAVHPVHVEAVSGVVGRADILACIAFLLSFLSYYKGAKEPNYQYVYMLATFTLAAASLLFKENGVTVLGFCIIYEIVTRLKLRRKKSNSYLISRIHFEVGSIRRITLLIVCIIVLLYSRWLVMGGTKPTFKPIDNPAAFSNTTFIKVATYNYIYFLNLLLFLWPQWLCYDWSMGCVPLVETIMDYRILPIMIMWLFGGLLILAIARSINNNTKRSLLLAVSLIVVPFLPAANIFFPVGFVVAERILYLPSLGYCLLVSIGLKKIIKRKCKIGITLLAVVLITFSLRSWQRSLQWRNEFDLFVSGLAVCPLNAKVHYNVAKVADARHDTGWAVAEYKQAISLYPEYYQAMNNLANLLKDQKLYDESEYYLRAAISHKEDFPAAWMNLGIVLANTRRLEESLEAYKNALNYRKNYTDCFYNLGNLYLEMNKTEEAIENWLLSINYNPKHVLAWTNLMALLDNSGKIKEAFKLIPSALKELPDSPSVNFAIANIYGKANHYEQAEEYFTKAIKLFGDKVQAIHYANFGVLYHRWKKYKLAKQMYENALSIDPNFKSAKKNLELAKKYIKR